MGLSIRTVCSMDAAAEPPWTGLRRVMMDNAIVRRHDMDLVLQYKCFIDLGKRSVAMFTSRTRSEYIHAPTKSRRF